MEYEARKLQIGFIEWLSSKSKACSGDIRHAKPIMS